MNRRGHIQVPNRNPYSVFVEKGKRYDQAEAFQRAKRFTRGSRRRVKKFLYEVFDRPGATLRQKVILRRTRCIFDLKRVMQSMGMP